MFHWSARLHGCELSWKKQPMGLLQTLQCMPPAARGLGHQGLPLFFYRKYCFLYLQILESYRHRILHMHRQHCCRCMCKIVWWSDTYRIQLWNSHIGIIISQLWRQISSLRSWYPQWHRLLSCPGGSLCGGALMLYIYMHILLRLYTLKNKKSQYIVSGGNSAHPCKLENAWFFFRQLYI